MDLDYIKRKALAKREYTAKVGPEDAQRTIQMRLPTEHEITLASLRSGIAGMADAAAVAVLQRALVVQSVVGWSGVLCSDLLPGVEGDHELPFETGAVSELLDAQHEWGQVLADELYTRLAERRKIRDAATKN